MTVLKAELALVVGLAQLNSVQQPVTNQKPKCCFSATNLRHNCNLALVAFCFVGYNIGYKGQKTMTLDQLIFHLEVLRAQCGTGDIPVLFRDPGMDMLCDEFSPQLCNVQKSQTGLLDAFDMNCGDLYVEL